MRLAALAVVVCFSGFLAPAGASAAGYASSGGDLTLRMTGGSVELLDGGGSAVATDAPGADWVIQGVDGVDDTLTVRNPEGGIVSAHVQFAGGDGGGVDALHVIGGRADSSAARFAGPDSGSIEATRGAEDLASGSSGLEPLLDTTSAASLVIDYGAGDDQI